MKVREAKPGEVDLIADLQQELMLREKKIDPIYYSTSKDARKRFVEFAKEKIGDRDSRLLVATADGKIVGYILGWVKERPPVFKLRKVGYISDFLVIEEFRRRGIGKKLIRGMLAWFKNKKLSHVEIVVTSKNKLALNVWEKLGFKEYRKIMRRKPDLTNSQIFHCYIYNKCPASRRGWRTVEVRRLGNLDINLRMR